MIHMKRFVELESEGFIRIVRIDAIDAITCDVKGGKTYVFIRGTEEPFTTSEPIESLTSRAGIFDDVVGYRL